MSTARDVPQDPPRDSVASRAAIAFGAINLIGLILLQKLALPFAGSAVQLCLPIYLGSLALVLFGLRIAIDPIRLLLYAALCASVIVSQLLSGVRLDIPALALFLLLYIPFLFVIEADRLTCLRVLGIFQAAMMVVVALVFAQHALQFTIGPQYWPDLNRLPEAMLLPFYNYLQPFSYGSAMIKPNAIVFLETSFVSQFLAIALVIEIVFFRRIAFLFGFAAGLFGTLAGTGLLILALAAPFLAFKLPPRMIALGAALAVVVMGAALATGWMETAGQRIGEFSTPGSSGYNRYIRPLESIGTLVSEPERVIVGHGAGRSPIGDIGDDTLPVSKMFYEYGLVATLLLMAYLVFAMFQGTMSKRVALTLFLYFNLGGGGLVVPVYVLLPVLLAANLRSEDEEAEPAITEPAAATAGSRPLSPAAA